VGQRTREFGIRSALGATRARIVRMVLREGLWLTIPGIALGLAGAFAAGRTIASAIFKFALADPTTYLAIALLQLVIALLACLLPAHRATTVDPIAALRAD
jgi:putative ABC transport system permease protein